MFNFFSRQGRHICHLLVLLFCLRNFNCDSCWRFLKMDPHFIDQFEKPRSQSRFLFSIFYGHYSAKKSMLRHMSNLSSKFNNYNIKLPNIGFV